ncbi:MAG: hypothetical protein AAF431_05480 [Pseudomonadota bacterium]
MTFAKRRLRNTMVTIGLVILSYQWLEIVALSLNIQQYYSGWLLVVLILLMLGLNLKKRFSQLGVGRTAGWAQFHYYSGILLFAVFLKHIEFALPDGLVEQVLAGLLALLTFGGLAGLLINRIFARRLAYSDEEILFERIPLYREQLQERVEALILEATEQSKSSTLADYYLLHLADFFARPGNTWSHLIGRSIPVQQIRQNLEQQMRYLAREEAAYALQLARLVEQKNNLDKHRALQGAMKYWGLAHLPVALVLSVFVIIHIVLVYAFRGAA